MNWYDKAVEQLEADLEAGLISPEEYRIEMRELSAEYREAAAEAAQDVYDSYFY